MNLTNTSKQKNLQTNNVIKKKGAIIQCQIFALTDTFTNIEVAFSLFIISIVEITK